MKSIHTLRLGGLCLLIVCLFSSPVFAQASAQNIERLEQKQAELRKQEESLRLEAQALSQAMATAETADGPGKAAYDEAIANFEEASEQYEADPSPTNKSRVRNAEFKLHLAERKYRSSNDELRKLEEQQDQAEAQLIAVRSEIEDISAKLPVLRQQLAERREREKAEKARAEARARERAAQADSQPAPQQTAAAAQQAEPASSPPQQAPQTAAKPAANGEPIELDRNFTLLTNRAQVLTELANLELRVGGDSLKIRSNKILNVRHFVDGEEVEKNSHRFKGLGNYQYRADAVLKPGQNRLRVSFSRWNITMPESFGNQEMVILMDASDRNAPQIVCFPAKLAES